MRPCILAKSEACTIHDYTSEASRNTSSRRPPARAGRASSSLRAAERVRMHRNSSAGIAAIFVPPLFPLVSFPTSCSRCSASVNPLEGAGFYRVRPETVRNQRHISVCAPGACAHPRPQGGRQVRGQCVLIALAGPQGQRGLADFLPEARVAGERARAASSANDL